MDFLPLAKDRYSVRKLKDQPVEQEKIEKILEAAMVAPTAANYQPFRVWVMKNPEALEKVRSAVPMPFVQESPVVFVVGGDPNTAWTRSFDGHNFADVDASIVATHMMLEVHELGLGTTWVGYIDVEKMVSLFPDMKGYSLVAVFGVGYPAEDAEPAKLHSNHHADRYAVGTNRDERVQTNGRLSYKMILRRKQTTTHGGRSRRMLQSLKQYSNQC